MLTFPAACLLLAMLPQLSPGQNTTAIPPETASQFYLRWRTTAMNANSLEEITPFWTAEMRQEFDMRAAADKAALLPMMKHAYGAQTDVKVLEETPTPTGATLSLEAFDAEKRPLAGTVDVVKENGAWKVSNAVERWQPKRSPIED